VKIDGDWLTIKEVGAIFATRVVKPNTKKNETVNMPLIFMVEVLAICILRD